jgi:hypothetical protein
MLCEVSLYFSECTLGLILWRLNNASANYVLERAVWQIEAATYDSRRSTYFEHPAKCFMNRATLW